MQVPELVPEIASLQGFGVGDFEVLPARCGEGAWGRVSGEGLEHRQVGRAGFVQAGQHGVHGTYASLRGDVEVGPTLAWVGHAIPVGDGFQRADDGRSDGHYLAPRLASR